MKHCNKCNIDVDTTRMTCPLCRDVLVENNKPSTDFEPYEGYKPKPVKLHIARRIFIFLSIMICSVCAVINALTYKGTIWSLVVIGGIIYLWVLIKGTIISRRNIALKLVLQALAITILLLQIQLITPNVHWLTPYALPFIMIGTIFSITLLIFIKTMRYKDYMLYLIAVALVGTLPLILSFTKSVKPLFILNDKLILWPSIASALYAVLTIVGMFIFGDRATKDEFKKRFHI
ncbi:MAG: DUF6320 domain-containing protein [Bacilli bacterium]|nr:DUF6320 domain-containing protein [Bacilli bacterium]